MSAGDEDDRGKEHSRRVSEWILGKDTQNLSQDSDTLDAFDVVTVFKYNIPCSDKDEFIKALASVIKPNGIV